MGKWLNKTLRPTDSAESENHADLEDIALLAEGRLDGAERKRLLRHLNRCGQCYEILQETLKDVSTETSGQPAPTAWWKRKSLYALAASIILVFVIGGQLIDKFWIQQAPITSARLTLDQELKDILLEDSTLQWENVKRIERLISALHKKGLRVKQFNRVILSRPYYQTKSLFGPEETLHIRIEDDVAYLEVKEGN
jgi:hypothetical protein